MPKMFTMSMFMNEKDLYKAKSEYFKMLLERCYRELEFYGNKELEDKLEEVLY